MKFRRSIFASARWIFYPATGLICSLVFTVGLFATQASLGLVSIIFCTIFIIGYSIATLYAFMDWHDEIYEVSETGDLTLRYRTIGKYSMWKQGPVKEVRYAWVAKRGLRQYVLNFGDVNLEAAWSKQPFVLRDVQNPRAVAKRILDLAQEFRGKHKAGMATIPDLGAEE